MKRDGSAQVPAVVLEIQLVFVARQKVLRVEAAVAGKVVGGTMKVLRAALGDDVDLRAARLSVLRVVRVGDHLELVDGVDAHVVNLRGVRADVEVLGAVERETGEVFSQTIDLLSVAAKPRARFVASLIPP